MTVEEEKKCAAAKAKCAFSLGEHIDCRDTVNKWINAEIIAIKNGEVRVHYSGWSYQYDEFIPLTSDRLLKQWKEGMEFKVNQRVDILDTLNKWLEARIIEIEKDRIKVHFKGFVSKWDEWLPINSERIKPIGTHSNSYGGARFRQNQPDKLTSNDNILSQASSSSQQEYTQQQKEDIQKQREKILIEEERFCRLLAQKNLVIKSVQGDGNCLFRAVAHQIYNNEEYHEVIRQKCMDYIFFERDFFVQFITCGIDEYLLNKRQDGVWGDDVEIQALSELYNRPIEIYAYSNTPMRTFHEVTDVKSTVPIIRLSYHGKSHYNSIINADTMLQTEQIVTFSVGAIEDEAIARTRLSKREKKQKDEEEEKKEEKVMEENIELHNAIIQKSRNEFELIGKRDMEAALLESMNEFKKPEEKEVETAIKISKDEYEQKVTDENLLDIAIENSMKEFAKESTEDTEKQIMNQILEMSKKEAAFTEPQTYYNPAIQMALESGFTEDQAVEAYSIAGENVDLMFSYLYDNY